MHLNHGPIDLIIKCDGDVRDDGYQAATRRFETIIEELVEELPVLRKPVTAETLVMGPVARRMYAATVSYLPAFITPMAAVAGAVADEILHVIAAAGVQKAYVNNGGDVAFHLTGDAEFTAAMARGHIRLRASEPARGVASSGWRGRSWSLGIADNVTVVARTSAMADAAATMIANAVDLPGHTAIERTPADTLAPDSDLGSRAVTTAVGSLSAVEVEAALDAGESYANELQHHGLVHGAALTLNETHRVTGAVAPALDTGREREPEHA